MAAGCSDSGTAVPTTSLSAPAGETETTTVPATELSSTVPATELSSTVPTTTPESALETAPPSTTEPPAVTEDDCLDAYGFLDHYTIEDLEIRHEDESAITKLACLVYLPNLTSLEIAYNSNLTALP